MEMACAGLVDSAIKSANPTRQIGNEEDVKAIAFTISDWETRRKGHWQAGDEKLVRIAAKQNAAFYAPLARDIVAALKSQTKGEG